MRVLSAFMATRSDPWRDGTILIAAICIGGAAIALLLSRERH